MLLLKVTELIGSPIAVATEDGQHVFEVIAKELHSKAKVRLSFEGVKVLNTAFLNAAIGQLYGEFPREEIREFLRPEGLSKEDALWVMRVAESAREYFANPEPFDQAIDRLYV